MSTQIVNRNNVVAGIFLIGSITLAVIISFLLSDITSKFGSKKTYIMRFPTSIGVQGLESGAMVSFGGLNVGTVKSISPHTIVDKESGQSITLAHDVLVSVRSDLVIYEDAYADLTLPMLGGVSRINIPSAGSGAYDGGPEDANSILDEGEILRGRFAPSILSQLGFTTEEAEKIRETIEEVRQISQNVNETSVRVRRMAEALEPDFLGGVDDGKTTLANIRAFSEKFNGNGEDDLGWAGKVDTILVDVKEASTKITPAIEDAHATIKDAKDIVSESKPRVASILENVDETTSRVRTESMDKLDELLDKGSLALASYQDVATEVSTMISVNRPKIDATLSSARDVGVQANLFVEEIRSQPWRLLKKPSEEDLKREPIYEAARAYASAVSDLRIASEALDAAVSLSQRTDSDQESQVQSTADIARIARVVEEAYGRYEQAERGLLEILRTSNPNN